MKYKISRVYWGITAYFCENTYMSMGYLSVSRGIKNAGLRYRYILEFAMRVSSFAYASWLNFRRGNSTSRDAVRCSLQLFQVVKRNRTFTRRKCIIPPTFPPYKDAREEDTMAQRQAIPWCIIFFRGETSFLLLSIDACFHHKLWKLPSFLLYATHLLFSIQLYDIMVYVTIELYDFYIYNITFVKL